MYNITQLLDKVCNAKFTYESYDKKTYESVIISSSDMNYASKREAIRSALDVSLNEYYEQVLRMETKIAELEAKVYVYERIIANSNFAPVIKKGDNRWTE